MSEDAIETDYEIGQDNVEIMGLDIHNPVFVISGLMIIAFVLITLMFQETAGQAFNEIVSHPVVYEAA